MKGKSERQQKSSGSKPLAQSPSKGGCVQVRVPARSLILGQMWKKNFSIHQPIFKKRGMPTQNNSESLVHINVRRKPKPTVKNYQRLGYISYEATTSTWVTFSYELTGNITGMNDRNQPLRRHRDAVRRWSAFTNFTCSLTANKRISVNPQRAMWGALVRTAKDCAWSGLRRDDCQYSKAKPGEHTRSRLDLDFGSTDRHPYSLSRFR